MNQLVESKDIEKTLILGDLSTLSSEQRVSFYMKICQSLGLNYLTKPFDYITLNGKLTLYAKRDAADQLRKLHKVGITIQEQKIHEGVFLATVCASLPDGRVDSDVGAVPIAGLKGEQLSNAIMKAITKAKRRVTLSICGLGMLDEIEVESVKEVEKELPQPKVVKQEYQFKDPVPLDQIRVPMNYQDAPPLEEPLYPVEEQVQQPQSPGETIVPYGKFKGKKISELPGDTARRNLEYWKQRTTNNPPKPGSSLEVYMTALEMFLTNCETDHPPFPQ